MKNFVEELKERRIWRTLVAYPGVSFVLLQAVEFFINNYGLDARFLTASFIALLSFLPVALIWNWFHGESGSQSFKKPEIGAYLVLSSITVVMVGWYWLTTDPVFPSRAVPADPARSIAVMPFFNPGDDAGVQYLCDGIAESLINWLATQDEVRVSSKSASFRLREDDEDPVSIGNRLGVDSVLQGRLEKIGDQIVISTSLVDSRDGSQIWGERLVRQNTELLSLERNIVQAITSGLSLNVTAVSKNSASVGTDNDEAYQHYLRGHYLIQSTSGGAIDEGLQELREAIRVDPAFGLPYADIADALVQKIYYAIDRSNELLGEARTAARSAIALAPELAEAHTALASIYVYFDFDWEAGEQAYETAISLNPQSPVPYHRYSDYLWLTLRFERAIEMARNAIEIDPLDSSSLHALGFSNMLAGNFADAAEAFGEWNRFHPQSNWSYVKHAVALARNNQCDEALLQIAQAEQRTGGNASPLMQSWMAWVYHLCDEPTLFARSRHRIEQDLAEDGIGDAGALVWLGLIENNVEEVIESLEEQFRTRSVIVPFFHLYSLKSLDLSGVIALRDDPHYIKMITQLNFPSSDWSVVPGGSEL